MPPHIIADIADIHQFIGKALEIQPERYQRFAASTAEVPRNGTYPTDIEAKSIQESWSIYQPAEERRKIHSLAVLQDFWDSAAEDWKVKGTYSADIVAIQLRGLQDVSLRAYWLSQQRNMLEQLEDTMQNARKTIQSRICYQHERIPVDIRSYLNSFGDFGGVIEEYKSRNEDVLEFEKRYGKAQGSRVSKSLFKARVEKLIRQKELLRRAKALVLVAQDINRVLES